MRGATPVSLAHEEARHQTNHQLLGQPQRAARDVRARSPRQITHQTEESIYEQR